MDLLSEALSESGLGGDFFADTLDTQSNVSVSNDAVSTETNRANEPAVTTSTVTTTASRESTPAPEPAEVKPPAPQENLDEVDMFSQALMQLSETNKQAEEYEKKHKLLHPEPKPQPKPPPPAPVNTQEVQSGLSTVVQQPQSVITTQLPYVTPQTVKTGQTVVTLPQQHHISTPQQSGSPVSIVAQLASQPKRTGNPLVLTNNQIQALQRSGSPVTILPSTPNSQGNVVYLPQSGGIQGSQTKKITVIKGGNTGVQQVISLPSSSVAVQPTVGTPGQQVISRQTVNTAGKKVHVVTLSPQVVQTPNGPRTVTIKKVQQAVVTTGSPTVVGGSLPTTPVSRLTTTPSAQRFTVTRTSDGQIRIVKPTDTQQNQPAIVSNPQGVIRIQPNSGVRNSPQPIVVSSSPAGGQAVTPQRQQTVQPRIITMGATPLSSRTTPAQPQMLATASTTSGIPVTPTTTNNGLIKTELTEKDVSRLWVTDDIKLKKLITPQPQVPVQIIGPGGIPAAVALDEAEEDEDEELGHAETYAEYMPPKLKLGHRHPDPVVETSSLSSVEPPDVWYRPSIPESIIDYGQLSALQLETIVYTCQKHDQFLPNGERAGFLVGDGAGVGKGRTIAGIIYENYLQGRKRSLWLSVSNDLRVDAERDLRDIGAGKIEVHPLNKFKYAKISSHVNGSVKKGVIFATYSSLIGESTSSESKYRTRFKQLVHWLGKDFDGCIVFDECHRAKNLCPVGSSKPTKTGTTVLELQNKLKKARIVYASATGASEPRNMAYMTRLGLWGKGTPFREFNDFINAVEKRGVGAMELVAMDMKLRGQYIARQLSFHGVSFKIEEIPVPKDFYKVYNESVKLWVEAREAFQQAADLLEAEHRMRKSMWGQFWSAHQRYFKYLCISAKVPHCVRVAREAVKNGKCVVIGLQSTGEARTLEQLEDSGGVLDDFVSTVKGVFQTLVEKHFPAPDRKKTSDWFSSSFWDDSPVPSPSGATKRKKKGFNKLKRAKHDREDDWSSNSSSDSEKDDEKKSDSSADSSSSSESELSLSETEESSDDPDDDFNPFGNGSDSDDDPWLKKSKTKKAKEKKKKKKKPPKEKKKKEKKEKKKKKKKEKDKTKDEAKDYSDSDDMIDKQFDNYLKNSSINAAIGGNSKTGGFNSAEAVEKAVVMKADLLRKLERLADRLPANTLDELIDSLGGSENVAEMTGRKGRVVSTDDGGVQYESRSEYDVPLEILNLTEKQRFMDGDKNIAIISEAASSGISLQADRRAINQRRRVHITLELPWSADRAIQQFGRTHRSNQVSAPEYMFMISELAGERRFAATVAKRLESLGALTHGDRRATESRDLSRFNIDNKYGRAALEAVMKSVLRHEAPIASPPTNYSGNFFDDVRQALVGVGMISWDDRAMYASLEKDYNNMSKFLNRILGVEVELQNLLFKYFQDTLKAIILQAKRNGRWDMGILDLGSGGEEVKLLETQKFTSNFSGTNVKTQLHTVRVERGLAWKDAMEKWHDHSGPDDGFYISAQIKNHKKTAILAVVMGGKKSKEKLFRVYRPNTGLQLRAETLEEIRQKYRKVLPDTAQAYWEDQYYASVNTCSHAYWKGNCRRAYIGRPCEVGLRCRTYYVLSGSVLGCWTKVEAVLASLPGGHATRMQIIRLKTDEGLRIVGALIPEQALKPLTTLLSSQTPLEEPRPLQHVASAPVLNNLNMRNLPSPTFANSPLLMPHTNSMSSFRTVNSGGSALQPTGLSGTPTFRISQPTQQAVTPKFRVAPAKPKVLATGGDTHAVAISPPIPAKPSFTVMESPEDDFRDMPMIL